MIKHHHEAFFFWRELMYNGHLIAPFEVVHVDAHADLGLGDASWAYILSELLVLPPEKRQSPKTTGLQGLGFGNYLAFAIACRWVSKLTFVLHPGWDNDLPWTLFKNFDEYSGYIQLKLFNKKDIDIYRIKKAIPLAVEPEVVFRMVEGKKYNAQEPFNYVIICQSPGYTPSKADDLLKVFAQYIEPV